jgi:hypothetical protein
MDPITGLAYGRVAVGTIALFSPRRAEKLLGLDPGRNPQMSPLTRMFGARELALGGLTLAASGDARERMIQVGVAVDGADGLAGIAAVASGAMSKKDGIMLAVVAAGAVATAVKGLRGP